MGSRYYTPAKLRDITHHVKGSRDITHRRPVDNLRGLFAISHTALRDITHRSSRYHTPKFEK